MTKRFVQYEVQFHAVVVVESGTPLPAFRTLDLRFAFESMLQQTAEDLPPFLSADHGVRWIAIDEGPA